ncbi:MAG: hypothetical protein Alpg2KO_13980 [Alphaproteobacteria bacterium]
MMNKRPRFISRIGPATLALVLGLSLLCAPSAHAADQVARGGDVVPEPVDPSNLPLLNRLAADGGREVQRVLGMELLRKPGETPYDFSAGRSWLEQAAAQGDCISAHGLAAIHGWPSEVVDAHKLRNYHRLSNNQTEYNSWMERSSRLGCIGARVLSHPDLSQQQMDLWPSDRTPRHILKFAEHLYEAGIPGMNRLIAAEYMRAGHRRAAEKWIGILRPALSPDLTVIYAHADSGKADWQWQLGLILIRLERLAEHITGKPERYFGFRGTAKDWIARAAEQGHPLALQWKQANTKQRPSLEELMGTPRQTSRGPVPQAGPARTPTRSQPAASSSGQNQPDQTVRPVRPLRSTKTP